MHPVLDEKLPQILGLCPQYQVRRLELFGSGAGQNFQPQTSDFDFLVEFTPTSYSGAADRYFGLLAALESLLGRPVDLVELKVVDNPYFLQAIQPQRLLLYAA